MYLGFRNLGDLIDNRQLSVRQKRRALRRLPFTSYAWGAAVALNLASSDTAVPGKGLKVDFRTYVELVRRWRVHKRRIAQEAIDADNVLFAKKMEAMMAQRNELDRTLARKRQPYGLAKKIVKRFRNESKEAATKQRER